RIAPLASRTLLPALLGMLVLTLTLGGCSGRQDESKGQESPHGNGATGTSGGAGAGSAAPGSLPLFNDLGDYHFPITTSVPRAQQYFDQGIRLLYGFNLEQAKLAFDEAARLDPKCAMAFWGIALALGPNIYVPRLPDQMKDIPAAMAKAQELAPNASP